MGFNGCGEKCEEVGVWYLVEESAGRVRIQLDNIKEKEKEKVEMSWCQQTNARMKTLLICHRG